MAKWHVSVLHLVTRSHGRGAEQVALELAAALGRDDEPHTVLALAPAFDGSRLDELPTLLSSPSLGSSARARAAWRLRARLRRPRSGRPRIVVAHGGSAAIVAVAGVGLLSRRHRPAVVWQRILPFPRSIERGVRRLAWRAVANRVDLAIALTDEIAAETRLLAPGLAVSVIPNFRDPGRFAGIDRDAARAALRRRISAPSESDTARDGELRLIGLVGHLIEQKQPLDALAAFAEIRARGLRVELVVAGDGPLAGAFDGEVERLGLASVIHRLGHVDDVGPVLCALDALVLSSNTEGVPGILIEAQMCGLPVISYPVGGVGSVIRSGDTGVIVASSTPSALAAAVVDLLGDDETRTAMGARALANSVHFETASAVSRYAQHFAALASMKE